MDPNFVLHERTCDAEPPDWPHVVCADGFAWHPAPERRQRDVRPCFQGLTHAPSKMVAAVLQGRPIDRLWALRLLLVGEHDDDQRWPGIVVALWPDECRGCARDHTSRAIVWRRAALAVQPEAIDALRAADPPWYLLREPRLPADRRYRPRAGSAHRVMDGLPLCSAPDETARAQISWAYDLAAQREHPLALAPRKAAQDGTGQGQ